MPLVQHPFILESRPSRCRPCQPVAGRLPPYVPTCLLLTHQQRVLDDGRLRLAVAELTSGGAVAQGDRQRLPHVELTHEGDADSAA